MHGCVSHSSDNNIHAISIYIYGYFSPHHRQSIVSSVIKAEEEATELHFAHTGSKGVEYTLAATKRPSTWEREQKD
jgi:hypothetical protein